jgi:predicted nuclease of predicted toxin-antitoxin system
MRFLADQGISPVIVAALNAAGHDCIHVRDLRMSAASDEAIVAMAIADARVVVTEDADFGAIVVRSGQKSPSIVYFRDHTGRASVRIRLLAACLPAIAADLRAGAVVVIEDTQVRVRRLDHTT